MPTLKGLTCQIRWADTNAPFKEHGTCYGDGLVETFIAVPDKPQPFNILITSKVFIYEGLAAVVYMDGVYQANRNRVNLVPPKKGVPRGRTDISFTIRQKEKTTGDGTYIGRSWRFDNHNIVPDPPKQPELDHFEQLGTIEVLILRCRGRHDFEIDASDTSSAAESRILEHCFDVGDDEASEDGKPDTKATKTAVKESEDDGGGMMGGMFGIFDGAADYPYEPPRYSSKWSSHPAPPRGYDHGYWHSESYPTPHHGIYYGLGPQAPHREYRPASAHPPIEPRGPPKRVHFDHGPPRTYEAPAGRPPGPPPPPHAPPPDWDAHYSDRSSDKHHGPHRPGYTPGLSDWQESYWAGHDNHEPYPPSYGPGYHYPHHRVHTDMGQGSGKHVSGPHPPPHHGYGPQPSYYNQNHLHQGGSEPPCVIKYPPHGQPPFAAVPPFGYGHYHHPYYPQWGAMGHGPSTRPPHPSEMRKGSGGSIISPKSQPQAQQQGSANQGENVNTASNSWDQANTSGGNDWNSGGGDGGNATVDPNQQSSGWAGDAATNNADNNAWGNGGENNQGWQNDNANGTSGDANAGTGWDNQDNSGGAPNSSGDNWDNPPAENNGQQQPAGGDGWGNSNDASNLPAATGVPAAADAGWGSISVGAAAAPSASSTTRPLFGPHGAYYRAAYTGDSDLPCLAAEEPPYDVPQSFATETGSRMQVQPGKGYFYIKKRRAPEYIDSVNEPYARFIFKYRTTEELKKDIDLELDVEPSGNEEVQKFQDLSKEALIQMVMRAQGALGGKIPSPPPPSAKKSEVNDSSEAVTYEPPDVSHLGREVPRQRSASGANQKKMTDDAWNTAPAAANVPGAWTDDNGSGAVDQNDPQPDNWGGNTGNSGNTDAWGGGGNNTSGTNLPTWAGNADQSQVGGDNNILGGPPVAYQPSGMPGAWNDSDENANDTNQGWSPGGNDGRQAWDNKNQPSRDSHADSRPSTQPLVEDPNEHKSPAGEGFVGNQPRSGPENVQYGEWHWTGWDWVWHWYPYPVRRHSEPAQGLFRASFSFDKPAAQSTEIPAGQDQAQGGQNGSLGGYSNNMGPTPARSVQVQGSMRAASHVSAQRRGSQGPIPGANVQGPNQHNANQGAPSWGGGQQKSTGGMQW